MNNRELIEAAIADHYQALPDAILLALRGAGSLPASCSRTRGAGEGQGRQVTPTTAPPFPDLGGGELRRLVDSLKARAAKYRQRGSVTADGSPVSAEDCDEMIAAEIDRAAEKLAEAIESEPLTTSGVEGDETCPMCDWPVTFPTANGWRWCRSCRHEFKGTGRPTERSVSGNDSAQAPRDASPETTE